MLMHELEGVAGFHDRHQAAVGDAVEVAVGEVQGNAVLPGAFEASVLHDLSVDGIHAREDAAIANHVEAILMEQRGGNLPHAPIQLPGQTVSVTPPRPPGRTAMSIDVTARVKMVSSASVRVFRAKASVVARFIRLRFHVIRGNPSVVKSAGRKISDE